MKPETALWFHEADVAIDDCFAGFTRINSMTSQSCESLFMAVEKSIKATLVEHHGYLPSYYHHHKLVELCKDAGFWVTLPSSLQGFVQTMSSYGPQVRYPNEPAYQNLVSSSVEEWKQRLGAAKELNTFLQRWVLGAAGTMRPHPSTHP